MNIIFSNIRIIDPTTNFDSVVNLHIVDGIINQISTDAISDVGAEFIAGEHLVAAPGFIDIHTHFREPGYNYKETLLTGATAAANGGFTEVVCMPNTNPAIDNNIVVEYIKSKTATFPVKVHIAAAITKERKGEQLTNMHSLANDVVYFTDDGSCVSSAEIMKRAFEYSFTGDYLIAQHCEEHSLTKNFSMNEGAVSMRLGLVGYPAVAENIIIERDISLAEYYGNRRYHAQHISTKEAVNIIRIAKQKGLRVSCEVTPHHLWWTEEAINNYDSNYKMNPPLRQVADINALIDGLRNGTIDCIATDHAPHSPEECEVEFEKAPNGIIGLETAIGAILTLLYHKHNFELIDIIKLFATNPRKIIGMPQIKIAENELANLTIFALAKEWIVDKNKFKSKGRNTPFNNCKFKGKPEYIINKRQIIKSEL